MPKELVVFGSGAIAELAHYYFCSDSEHEVVAFTLDEEYIERDTFCGLPVVPFADVQSAYPPEEYALFIALSYSRLNEMRKEKFLAGKEKGYTLASYISSRASVLNDGRVGDNVTLWSGNHIGHHSTIHDHTFIASHVVVSGGVVIGESCFLGVNATLRDHITVGEKCVIGAGALLLGDAEPKSIYRGTKSERSKTPSTRLKKI